MGFATVNIFESQIARHYGAPFAVAVDCCTHGLELALRYTKAKKIEVPKHTYLSIPMLASKLTLELTWKDENWYDYYYITENIIDSAVYWKESSYIDRTFMVLSFQFKKHLNLGRGGMILTDNEEAADELRRMSYDGRDIKSPLPWDKQEINTVGYHYYMTPETALMGIHKIPDAVATKPKERSYKNYPDLTNYKVFSNG